MAAYKTQTPRSGYGTAPASTPGVPTKFQDRDLAGTSPLKEQFEPTEAAPVRQHYKMAGGCD